MDGETASTVDEQVAGSRGAAGGGTDTTGKHRILAELKRVEQESKFLEKEAKFFRLPCTRMIWRADVAGNCESVHVDGHCGLGVADSMKQGFPVNSVIWGFRTLKKELEELEKTENVSTICEELLRFIETRPDPLLSVTNGPINPVWDRWFEGPQDAQGCRCIIL